MLEPARDIRRKLLVLKKHTQHLAVCTLWRNSRASSRATAGQSTECWVCQPWYTDSSKHGWRWAGLLTLMSLCTPTLLLSTAELTESNKGLFTNLSLMKADHCGSGHQLALQEETKTGEKHHWVGRALDHSSGRGWAVACFIIAQLCYRPFWLCHLSMEERQVEDHKDQYSTGSTVVHDSSSLSPGSSVSPCGRTGVLYFCFDFH